MEELELDASRYIEAVNEYETEFKNLLLNIYSCYILIIADKQLIPPKNENEIRNILLRYLKNTKIRNEDCIITGYIFEKEVDENDGRADIKIRNANEFIKYEEQDAYFIIECKRLDGESALNTAYVKDGIKRFTSTYKSSKNRAYYSSYYGINGMIGFVVKTIDIDANMLKIDDSFNIIESHKLYDSTYPEVKLYHLMMDFSNNLIQSE